VSWEFVQEQVAQRVGKGSPSSEEESGFREEPPTFVDFVEEELDLGIKLSNVQYEAAFALYEGDPRRVLEPGVGVREAVLLWGKGGGKDTVCRLFHGYTLRVVLCLHNPRKYLGLSQVDNIDLVNVSIAAKQSVEVFFDPFIALLKRWEWLKERAIFIESGKTISQPPSTTHAPLLGEVILNKDTIDFPLGVRAHSYHSQHESYEGKNILQYCMDEASGFRDKGKRANAHKVYETLKTSAESRFPHTYRGIIISWPRSRKRDFTLEKFKEFSKAIQESSGKVRYFASRACTWEANPSRKKEDYAAFKAANPEEYYKRYEVRPLAEEDAFIQYAEYIPTVVNTERVPAIDTETKVISYPVRGAFKQYVGKEIVRVNLRGDLLRYPRAIHVDLAQSDDRAAVAMGYGVPVEVLEQRLQEDGTILTDSQGRPVQERVTRLKTVYDFVEVWFPDKQRRLPISTVNVEEFVVTLLRLGFRIIKVSYDQWNSAAALERLLGLGVMAEKHNINEQDYIRWRQALYGGLLDLPKGELTDLALAEAEALRRVNKKVTHPEGEHDDAVQTLVGVHRLLCSDQQTASLIVGGYPAPAAASLPLGGLGLAPKGGEGLGSLIGKPQAPRLLDNLLGQAGLLGGLSNKKRLG